MKQSIPAIIGITLLLGGLVLIYVNAQYAEQPTGITTTVSGSATSVAIQPTDEPELSPDYIQQIKDFTGAVPIDTIPSSYTALVNRNYLLPAKYIPKDLITPNVRLNCGSNEDKSKMRKAAAHALEKMFRAASKKKLYLTGISAYRSYARQKQIYNKNVSIYGKDTTDAVSAKPGSSEHQTGLTIDISCSQMSYRLGTNFAKTKEGKWIKKNAHKYGYIIRYPEGKSKLTGYRYEPWHIRYVGKELASYLYKNNLTLEEYYGVSCDGDDMLAGIDVEDLKEYQQSEHENVSGSAISE